MAVFGDLAEHSAASILEIERLIAAQLSGSGRLNPGAEDSAPEVKNPLKGGRYRSDAETASPGESVNGPIWLRGRDSLLSPGSSGAGENGDLPFLPAGAEDVDGDVIPPLSKDDEFLRSAWARLALRYGSPEVGLLVLRRILEIPPEVMQNDEVANFVQDLSQARTVATELGLRLGRWRPQRRSGHSSSR